MISTSKFFPFHVVQTSNLSSESLTLDNKPVCNLSLVRCRSDFDSIIHFPVAPTRLASSRESVDQQKSCVVFETLVVITQSSQSPHQAFKSSLLQLVTQPVSRSILSNIFRMALCSLGWLMTFPAIHIGWMEFVHGPLDLLVLCWRLGRADLLVRVGFGDGADLSGVPEC